MRAARGRRHGGIHFYSISIKTLVTLGTPPLWRIPMVQYSGSGGNDQHFAAYKL